MNDIIKQNVINIIKQRDYDTSQLLVFQYDNNNTILFVAVNNNVYHPYDDNGHVYTTNLGSCEFSHHFLTEELIWEN